jgi:hypothetical protein
MYPIDTFDLFLFLVLSGNVCSRGQFPARMPAKRGRRQVRTQSMRESDGMVSELKRNLPYRQLSKQHAWNPGMYLSLNSDSRALSQPRSLLRLVFETLNEKETS